MAERRRHQIYPRSFIDANGDLTRRGTPTWYYGDEIAMEDVDVPIHHAADPPAKNDPNFGPDPVRTPMQ